MLNDTRLHSNITFHLPGYVLIRKDKNTNDSTAGGVALAIPNNWDVEPQIVITESTNGLEAVGVITSPPGGLPLKLMSLYNHPQHHVPRYLLEAFLNVKLNGRDIHGLIGGDLNSPHEAFSSRFTNTYGTSLLTSVNCLNLYVLDNEEPTTFHRGEPNILDLFICHPRSCHLIKEFYVGDSIGSDHLPLITNLEIGSTSPRNRPLFVKKSFDATSFKEEAAQTFENFNADCENAQQVEVKIEEFTKTLVELKDKHTKERHTRHRRSNLSPEILTWIKTRKALLKCLRKSQNPQEKIEFSQLYNRANKKVKQLLEEHDKEEKKSMITKMQSLDNTSKMWKLYNKFKSEVTPNNAIKRPLRDPQGNLVLDAREKAELFATRLESVHQTPSDPRFDQQFEKEVSNYMSENSSKFTPKQAPSFEQDEEHRLLSPITVADVRQKIQESKKDSAPGVDGISYKLLENCPEICFAKLIIILNFCLSIGYFPKTWKDAKVTMLQKHLFSPSQSIDPDLHHWC